MKPSVLRSLLAGVLVAISSPAMAGGSPASSPSLRVSVDPRVELFSVIYRLTGYLEHSQGRAASYYEAQVDKHFGSYRDHRAVTLATYLKESHNLDYGVQLSLAVHVDDVAHLKLRVPLYPWPETLHQRWTPELIEEFLAKARDFARRTDFAGFLASQRAFYAETASRADCALLAGVHVAWFESFFGPRPGAEFQVFISPLGGPHCFAFWVPTEHGVESTGVIGVWMTDRQGKPEFPRGPRGSVLISVTVHELAHSYVNPAVAPYLDELTGTVARMEPWLTGRFGEMVRNEGATGFMHESLTEAATIRYLQSTQGTFAARRRLVTNLKNGLFCMPELLGKLEAYEKQRATYRNFQAYLPELVAFFQDYATTIRSKAAVACAANASFPVCLGLFGAYILLTRIPSRRRPTPKAKTKRDRIVTSALPWALFGSAFEFIVLGNRPGIHLMLAGALLLVSATLMAGRSRWRPGRTAPSDPKSKLGSLRSRLRRYLPASLPLSYLLVLIGVPLLLSARFAWVISAIAVLVLLLRSRPEISAAEG